MALEGSSLALDDEGVTSGGFDLDGPADRVTVDILSGARKVLTTIELGARGAGRHSFAWEVPEGIDPELVASFRVNATSGAAKVQATTYTHDRVVSAITDGTTLMLELQHGGTVPYSQIKSFH